MGKEKKQMEIEADRTKYEDEMNAKATEAREEATEMRTKKTKELDEWEKAIGELKEACDSKEKEMEETISNWKPIEKEVPMKKCQNGKWIKGMKKVQVN